MGQFAGTTFGIGTPSLYPVPQNPFGGSGYGFGQYGIGTVPPLHQIAQLVQILPQQLQQLQILQQQQLVLLQQLLQQVPAQLQQLQQLTHSIPQQLQPQQPQWQQPFGSGVLGPIGFGVSPQPFTGQATSHVMYVTRCDRARPAGACPQAATTRSFKTGELRWT